MLIMLVGIKLEFVFDRIGFSIYLNVNQDNTIEI